MQESGFGSAGLTEVLLPSGYRVRGVIPGLASLARRGLLDTRVQQAVIRLVAREHLAQGDESDDFDEAAWQTTVDAFVAGFAREAIDPGDDEWLPVGTVDVDDMDQRDRQAIQMLVLRIKTADEITAEVEGGDYELEGPGELDRLAEFRDDGRGATARDDGEDVAPAAVGAAEAGG